MDPKTFHLWRRKLSAALAQAVESALAAWYDNADVTLQIRGARCVRVDIRVIDEIKP